MKRRSAKTLVCLLAGVSVSLQTAFAHAVTAPPPMSAFNPATKVLNNSTLQSPKTLGSPGPEQSVTLYMYPAHLRLNWSTPSNLFWDFLDIGARKTVNGLLSPDTYYLSDSEEITKFNTYYVSTMGHTITHVQCQPSKGPRLDRWTSMTGENYPAIDTKVAFTEALGLGVMLYQFNDGAMISGVENEVRMALNRGLQVKKDDQGSSHLPRFLEFAIGTRQCDALNDMLNFYDGTVKSDGSTIDKVSKFYYPQTATTDDLDKKENSKLLYFDTEDPYYSYVHQHGIWNMATNSIDRSYKPDPDAQVGGGCAPFGAAVLKQAGVYMSSIFDRVWRRPVDIAYSMVGDPDNKKRVTLVSILAGGIFGQSKWVPDGETQKPAHLDMYDPQLIWDFVGEVHCLLSSEELANGGKPVENIETVSYSKKSDYTCSTLPGVTAEQKAQRKEIGEAAKKWVQSMRFENKSFAAVSKSQKGMSYSTVLKGKSETFKVTMDGVTVANNEEFAMRNKAHIDSELLKHPPIPASLKPTPASDVILAEKQPIATSDDCSPELLKAFLQRKMELKSEKAKILKAVLTPEEVEAGVSVQKAADEIQDRLDQLPRNLSFYTGHKCSPKDFANANLDVKGDVGAADELMKRYLEILNK